MNSQSHDAKKILLITTGGTIESFYNPEIATPDIVPLEEKSCIPEAIHSISQAKEALASGKISAVELTNKFLNRIETDKTPPLPAFDHQPLCMKDSKHVTHSHLQNMAHYIYDHRDEHDSIIIIHGTDTMPIHGRKLREMLAEYDVALGEGGAEEKKVIFAGAMEPLRDAEKQWRASADGWEHLRLAFDAATNPDIATDTYFTYQGELLKASEWNKERDVDEATGIVKTSGFVERLQPSPEEKQKGHIIQ